MIIMAYVIGFLFIIFLPPLQLWGLDFYKHLDGVRINTIISNIISYLAINFIIWQFKRFADTRVMSLIFPTVTIIYLGIFSYFIFTRLGYSRHVLVTGYFVNLFYFSTLYFITQRYTAINYAVLPSIKVQSFIQQNLTQKINFLVLNQQSLKDIEVKGIIADLNSDQLDGKWEKFLAECTLKRIPVYNIKQMQESLTGRIHVEHLSENQFGTLLPSPFYMYIKRILDIIIILLTLPFTLFIIIVVAIAIKIENKDNIFFTQKRVGQSNKDFKLYKFRSMVVSAEDNGAMMAQINDLRITKVGAWIRKTRIDELPQIWNVIKGDMSLIGPRPEQRVFVDQFEDNIPFYIYRHVVKPGMTGWAQVMQGYASNEDDTTIKIQYDFYYIKHFSFWLDILIFLKTIRVIFTGFGAK